MPAIPQKLPLYERIAASLLISLFLFAIALNLYFDEGQLPQSLEDPRPLVNPMIEVIIKGAVAKPGTYQVLKGTPVHEAIAMAEPLEEASLSSIKKTKITRRRTITVKPKTKKTK